MCRREVGAILESRWACGESHQQQSGRCSRCESLCFRVKRRRMHGSNSRGMMPVAGACILSCSRRLFSAPLHLSSPLPHTRMSSNASPLPFLQRGASSQSLFSLQEAIRADPQIIAGSKKFQVLCSLEWRHAIGRAPINHGRSRAPPPIQPLASLFQCVYYTAEHLGDTRLHMH